MNAHHEAQSTIMSYVDINPVATLGTIDSDGSPHGAIVYVCADDYKPVIYFLTKAETAKYKNIMADSRVSLTITHPDQNNTLQAKGVAEEIREAQLIDNVMSKLTKLHVSATDWLPPVAKIRAGAYVLMGITLQWARLAEYDGMSIGDEHIFTQM